jgi:hypothetical protein
VLVGDSAGSDDSYFHIGRALMGSGSL